MRLPSTRRSMRHWPVVRGLRLLSITLGSTLLWGVAAGALVGMSFGGGLVFVGGWIANEPEGIRIPLGLCAILLAAVAWWMVAEIDAAPVWRCTWSRVIAATAGACFAGFFGMWLIGPFAIVFGAIVGAVVGAMTGVLMWMPLVLGVAALNWWLPARTHARAVLRARLLGLVLAAPAFVAVVLALVALEDAEEPVVWERSDVPVIVLILSVTALTGFRVAPRMVSALLPAPAAPDVTTEALAPAAES